MKILKISCFKGTVATASFPLGTVVGTALAGFIAESRYGWPGIFYIFGAISVLWGLIMLFNLYESPSLHPSISKEELFLYDQSNKCESGNTQVSLH